MSATAYIKRRWKLLLNILTIAALVALCFGLRRELLTTLDNLMRVKAWMLLLLIPVEALNYHAQARFYEKVFAMVDEKLSYWSMYKVSLELNFVNHVFPSGGVAGVSYFSYRLRQFGVRGAKATLVQSMKLLLLFSSFIILLVFGMVALAVRGHVNDVVLSIGASLTTLIVVGTLLFVYVIGSQARIHMFLRSVVVGMNWLIHLVRPRHPETINLAGASKVFEEFHQDYILMRSRSRQLLGPVWWSLVANIAEVAAVYVVYMAFGSYVNIGAVILAYAIANFAGLVSVLPGGVGIYEALMTSVLVATGIPVSLSLPVTIMYRVLNTLLQLPPGYALYHQTLRRPSPAPELGDE